MTPETPAKVTATTLPDEPERFRDELGALNKLTVDEALSPSKTPMTDGFAAKMRQIHDGNKSGKMGELIVEMLNALDKIEQSALLQSFNAERLRAEAENVRLIELQRATHADFEQACLSIDRLDGERNEQWTLRREAQSRNDVLSATIESLKNDVRQAKARAEAMAKAINAALSHLKFKDKANGDAGVYGGMIDCATEVLDTAIEQGAQHG